MISELTFWQFAAYCLLVFILWLPAVTLIISFVVASVSMVRLISRAGLWRVKGNSWSERGEERRRKGLLMRNSPEYADDWKRLNISQVVLFLSFAIFVIFMQIGHYFFSAAD